MSKKLQKQLTKSAQVLEDGLEDIQERLEDMPEGAKASLINALIGAIVGGLGGGAAGYASDDEAPLGSALRYGGTGAALGAAAGGLGTAGLRFAAGKDLFPGEKKPSALGRLLDVPASWIVSHPGLSAGIGIGGALAATRAPSAARTLRAIAGMGRGNAAQTLQDSYLNELRNIYGTGVVPPAAGGQAVAKKTYGPVGIPYTGRNLPEQITDPALRYRELLGLSSRVPDAPSPYWAAAPPVGALGGGLLDRYIRGDI
jgi:hypothetical protein